MDNPVTAPPDARAVPFAIGDPGRAAREVPAGAPGVHVGHADIELSTASLGGSLVHAATVRGLQHRAAGEPRQDAFALGRLSDDSTGGDWLIAVVCDGVGGLGRSHEAAQLASRRLVSLRADGMTWPDAFAWVNQEIHALDDRARMSGDGDADGMATTAMAVIVRREEESWVGEAAWVGDSPLWHLSPDGKWALVAGPAAEDDGGAAFHSTGVTNPLPTAEGSWQVQRFQVGGGALFLMSDGVGNPLKWNERVQETLAEWWREPPDPFAFGAQVGFARKTHIDDRTVVGIWPAGAAGGGSVAPPASASAPSDHGTALPGPSHGPVEAARHQGGDVP